MAKTGCAGSAIDVAPICLNFGITAPVLSCVITWRGRIETKSPLRTCVPGASPSACRAAIFSTSVKPIPSRRDEIGLERFILFEAAHAENAETDDISFLVYSLHHRVMASCFLIAWRVGKPHFKVIRFSIEPHFYFFGHRSSPAFGLSVK